MLSLLVAVFYYISSICKLFVTYILETLGAPGVAPERQDYVVYNDQLRPWYKRTGPA